MKRQITLWGTRTFTVVLLAVAAQYWGTPLYKQYLTPKKVEAYVPTAKVKQGPLTISFHEIGTLSAENSVPISSQINGKIISLVPEGTVVAPGQKLAELDTTELDREVLTRKLTYEQRKADVERENSKLALLKEQNRTEVEQAQTQLDFDAAECARSQSQLDKQKRLAAEKLVPGDKVDQADLDKRSKELAVQKGKNALALKKKEVESNEAQQMAAVRNAQNVVEMAKIDLDRWQSQVKSAIINAPAGGMVVVTKDWIGGDRRKLKEGDQCWKGMVLCELPNLTSMLVKVQVGEADAPKVRLDMPVAFKLEAVPDKKFHGKVKDISSLATEPRPWEAGSTPGRKNFDVTIAVKEVDPKTLKPGMTADVEFLVETIKDALYVPMEAISEQNGKTFVFVKNGKRWQRMLVKTGKHNDNFICLAKGPTKDQVIALRDPTRPLDEQEAGTSTSGADEKSDKKEAVPIPKPAKARK